VEPTDHPMRNCYFRLGSLSGWNGRRMKVTTHFHLVPNLRTSR